MKTQKKNYLEKKSVIRIPFQVLILLTIIFNSNVSAQANVELSDINVLNNTNWQGSLMYVDYSSGEETVLQTTMQLTIKGAKIIMSTQYNNEPKANSKGSIKLKKGGSYFGNEKVVEKSKLKDNMIKIVTTYEGFDNNKKATIYKTYLFNSRVYSVTKEIQLNGSKEKFTRNKYSYTRI